MKRNDFLTVSNDKRRVGQLGLLKNLHFHYITYVSGNIQQSAVSGRPQSLLMVGHLPLTHAEFLLSCSRWAGRPAWRGAALAVSMHYRA